VWSDARQPERRLDQATSRELDRLLAGLNSADAASDGQCTDAGGAVLLIRHNGGERAFGFPCGYGGDAPSRVSEIVLAGRVADWQSAPAEHAPPGLPLRRLVANPASAFSGPAERELLTEIRSASAWLEFWPGLNTGRRALPPAPLVDFGRETLLVARMETQVRGGSTVRIERVVEDPAGLTAVVTFQSPGPTCGGAGALSTPTDIVAIPALDRPIRWSVNRTTKACA
jgi:hypothetical protein